MLRISRDDTHSGLAVLTLQGFLVGEWADLLDREGSAACESVSRVVLDVAAVTFVDRAGVNVLRRLGRAGVEIVRCSPLFAEVLEQEGIAVSRDVGDGEPDA